MTTPARAYRRRLEAGDLEGDRAQQHAVDELERLHAELVGAEAARRGFRRVIARLARRPRAPVRGIYLWGSVGRGKTLLMDLFYHCLPFDEKIRQHFHRFMASIHASLRLVRDQPNPLDLVADEIAGRARVICFDEVAVTDIADAMILGNLFEALFARGVTLAATSNIEPKNLYRDGLQRQSFLPAIELIERHTRVLRVDGERDYRLRLLERADVYQSLADADAEARLAEYFAAIAPDDATPESEITILGRAIRHRRRADGVIWFDFDEICDGPRSQDDYIEISRLFQTVLLSDVPRFDATLENQARRFVALVDEFYDRRVKLILSATAPLEELYKGRRLAREFERTKSRLKEMQSYDYLAAAHRP